MTDPFAPPDRGATAQPQRLVAILSAVFRRGEWEVPANMSALVVFGGIELDFREAVFTSMRVEVQVIAVLGSVEIKIPDRVHVENLVNCIFGGSEMKDVGAGDPNGPVIVLSGYGVVGGVTVRGSKKIPPRHDFV